MPEFFRTIRPGLFNPKAIEDALRAAQRAWMNKCSEEFRKTTKGWKTRVDWFASMKEQGSATIVDITTDSDIYRYVDEGTKPHDIAPKKAKSLAFPSIFVPKTRPGSLEVGPGRDVSWEVKISRFRERRTGRFAAGKMIFRAHVHHPGTKARDFTGQIRKKMEPVLVKDMQKAMDEGARRSGHGM